MQTKIKSVKPFAGLLALALPVCLLVLLLTLPVSPLHSSGPGASELGSPAVVLAGAALAAPEAPNAPCPDGPTIDGVLLDECVVETFTVGGTSKSITVWYTNNMVNATRTVDGVTYNLSHWVNNDAEPQDVATWGREAWVRYFEIFNRHPFDTGCGNNINVRLEDGIGWAGIAYWASSGNCWIGIDSPTVRAGNAQAVVYHEFQHYLQYAFNDGCYDFLRANYDNGSAAGDAEFVEGYADLAMDAVDAALDATLFSNYVSGYNPLTSFYDKGYWDVFNKYFIEQLGSQWTPADPHHHMDAVRDHYLECDARDTLYVLDTLIPSLKAGMNEEKLFLNFFAANWAKDWADPVTQPELVYIDEASGPSYGSIPLWKDVNISSGSQSWSESTPDDWAARYYQVKPQSGCSYVTVNVDGAPGANLGINLMAADTVGATSVQRSAWIGENFARTFPGYGVHNRIVAGINAFATNHSYDVSFTCVTPALDILEPKQTNFALVGDPASPIAFLTRFKVTSGGAPVLGLIESSFSASAEGDAVTFVPGSFSQVGEEYWAIMLPPVKPVGTTFVDLRICLDGSICDTETDALLYVDPGNTDFALVFDGSGSMAWEDITGEGTRLVNAQKAGTVLADLLRAGDRVAVTSFSAFNNPVGCGLPSGSGNCALDIQTHLARTDIIGAATIGTVRSAINAVTAREWTPIGAGLVDAKNKLQAAPYSLNPKHIILLSDGDENVNPLYSAVRDEIIASGVVVDTIRFSNDAPGELLALIASDTGGSYRYVPTLPGSLAENMQVRQENVETLSRLGVPAELIERMAATVLPGPLGLNDVYDYYETKSQDAARLFHVNHTGVDYLVWSEASQFVDGSVNTLRLVVASKQPDYEVNCSSSERDVEVLPPTTSPRPIWIPVSPPNPNLPPPATWDIRHSLYDDVVIIPNPEPGIWKVRTMLRYELCEGMDAPAAAAFDVMMNGSAETNIQLLARFLPPIVNNRGMAGDIVPIVATLLDRNGALPGAFVIAAIERPGVANPHYMWLWDNGASSDGQAGDGIYGGTFYLTDNGGTYNVRLLAFWQDPDTSNWFTREWNGAFWITGPEVHDLDKDGMPDYWEERCKLNTQINDANGDLDRDGLTNHDEFRLGTIPCDPDSDNGGERDGSEVANVRNPRDPQDDQVRPLGHISIAGLNHVIRIRWTHSLSYTNMTAFISPDPDEPGQPVGIGNSGIFTYTDVLNDVPYFVFLVGLNGSAIGAPSEPVLITPKEDPDPPSGAMMINDGAAHTNYKQVMLSISSSDTPLEGAAQSANAHLGGPIAARYNTVSGSIEMRIANEPSFAGAVWEPLTPEKDWLLANGPAGIYTVYIQFRDGASNESFVILDDIYFVPATYLPMMRK